MSDPLQQLRDLGSGIRKHKISLAISLCVTFAALVVYALTFLGERHTPLFDFIVRLELDSLDTRFRLRGRAHPDPRIVIVGIDQRSQELLGRWPFPRLHFAHMLDNLRSDGARVVAFDITFSEPEEPLRPLAEQLARAHQSEGGVPPKLLQEMNDLQSLTNYDQQFAQSIQRSRGVVLGNYFLYTPSDVAGVPKASLDRAAGLLWQFSYPQVRATAATGKQDFLHTIQNYEELSLLPKGAEANIEILSQSLPSEEGGCGFFDDLPDADGVVRRALLALPYGQSSNRSEWDIYPSLDVQAVRYFFGVPSEQVVLSFGPVGISTMELGKTIVIHLDAVGRVLINYQGPAGSYPYVSIADVASGNFQAGTFHDKLVLVGASASGIGNIWTTPFGDGFPGVEVHANIVDNILHQNFLHRGSRQVLIDIGLILFLGLFVGIWLALTPPRWLLLGLLLLIPVALSEYAAFVHGAWLNFSIPIAFTLVPNIGLVAMYRVLVEEKEKRKVRGAFQHYLSPEVIRLVLENPQQVEPRKAQIAVMFTDIRGFTRLSEKLNAQVLADLLNAYLTQMTELVFNHQGTLDKYIGDAVMAFWGAPFGDPARDAQRACDTALAMISRVKQLEESWQLQGAKSLDIGVGINTGAASVGNMGSDLRYGYTAVGDAVNLASRLEGLNKEYGTYIILGESTIPALPSGAFLLRQLDQIRVAGKDQPVTIFELLGRHGDARDLTELVDAFAEARAAYVGREWSKAAILFAGILRRWPDDGPSRVFLTRSQEYMRKEPPAGWDGVYEMLHK